MKTKSGRGVTVKQRIEYDERDRARLTGRGRGYALSVLTEQGHGPEVIERLRPSLVSRYHRTTLLMPEGSRATVDTRMSFSAHETQQSVVEHAILETKSPGGASALDRSLWRAGFRPTGISKFGTGTAALYPELPSNKWARALREAFPSPALAATATATETATATTTSTSTLHAKDTP